MTPFLNEDFLLSTEAARRLYHDYGEGLPVLDCHTHLDAAALAADRRWGDIAELWLGEDHYKWRAMRTDGIREVCITGDAEPYEKFAAWAGLLPRLIGNPLYHWSQLELKRAFGMETPLTGRNADAVWEQCNAALQTLSARQLVRHAGVRLLYTTADPADSLAEHRSLAADFEIPVLPTWRPDRVMAIEQPDFAAYVLRLGDDIRDFDSLMGALIGRMEQFHALGCRTADHGLERLPASFDNDPERILRCALSGMPISPEEATCFRSFLLYFLAEEYQKRGWVMQLHLGALRNADPAALQALGADTGFDAIRGDGSCGTELAAFLGRLSQDEILPKTVIYNLNPADDAQVGAILGCYQSPEARGKLQQGSAWWFNDHLDGMTRQLKNMASLSVLANFTGMVTDSHSYLSLYRHEYFRRTLCRLLGGWVEAGEYPADWDTLGEIVQDICWRNAARYYETGIVC